MSNPFSKDYVSQLKPLPKQRPRPKTVNQPPKNGRAVLQVQSEMKLAKLRRGGI